MRKLTPYRWLVPIMALGCFAGGCDESAASRKLAQQQATEKLREVWMQRAEKYRTPDLKGDFYEQQLMVLKDLLNEMPGKVVSSEYERICATDVSQFSGPYTDLGKDYDNVLLQAFVERSLERKDARQVTTLLSHNCPRYIIFAPLEFDLAYRWPGSIERFFDAHAASKSPAARKDIVFCLGRAFPSLRLRFAADDEFVRQAHGWYSANRAKLQVNKHYKYLIAQPALRPGEDGTNLFVFRSN